jgi:glucokinase
MDQARAIAHAVCLDIGGTSVKSAVVRSDSTLVPGSEGMDPVNSRGSADEILGTFARAAKRALDFARGARIEVDGLGVSICGPFDYEKGICRIRGLDKYEAIYDVNVKEHLQGRLELARDLPFLFDVDSWSFARGEVWTGAGRPFHRVIVFTMGTGVGSAFAIDGTIVAEGPGVPWYGWISGQPLKDGMLNDYVSRTFMIRRYAQLTGQTIDVADMAERAAAGDTQAAAVFTEIGETLAAFLKDHNVRDFQADAIIFGGQISKSLRLFIDPVKKLIGDIQSLKAVLQASDIDGSALKGIGRFVFDKIRLKG